ncbi:Microtubule-associated protein 4 [Tetrabaena socialis]|uniref:Microtubule-associated protein 4 n=1 Tax=Tetrabaena socialis TaxID=47790 RepID=A0A2J8AG06_9CHLO|nr:Microtubule-associated protein 4 [Tetrabaena socialis]|eukprot:PNH11454.1 Microtubule-associated protein 4 [Tetrabaena socialis]
MTDDSEGAADEHIRDYNKFYKACLGKLGSIWRQIGHGCEEQRSQLLLGTDAVFDAWSKAVERAEAERQSLKALIQQQSTEIANIKADLDDAVSSSEATATPLEGEATLLRTLDHLKGTLQLWRTKRAARVQAYEALMAEHVRLKQQLGIQHAPAEDVDISTGALEYLELENVKLKEEMARRLSRAEDELWQLRAICRDLGEDSGAAAADAHPALRSLRPNSACSSEKESAEMLSGVLQLAGSQSYTDALGDLDLSDATFERLASKFGEMERLKVEREAQSRDVLEMLDSLWTALSIPEDAPERGMVHKLCSADRPQRLHKRTLDKCMAEVNRLEGCKAQAMRDLAMAKARELEQLCISTRISPPHTGPLLAELDKQGQMTQVLSKLVRLVAEVQAMVAKRAPILSQVQELLAAQADSAWLRAYNADENRYKGRDASRNMTRAIKANKLRERLAPMMGALLEALSDWELEEGGPFLYDEQVLQDTQLRVVEAELEQVALEKAPRPKQAAAAAAGSASKPPLSKPTHGAPAPSQRGPTPSSSSFSRGPPAASASSADRPMLTPRNTGEEARPRRASMAPSSSRESSIYRGAAGAPSSASKLARSNDFTPGALRAAAAAAPAATEAPTSSFSRTQASGMPPPVLTPPMRMSAPGASPMGRAGAGTGPREGASAAGAARASDGGGAGFKNSARDLFQRYLGDASNGGSSTTPSKTPAVAAASPVLMAAASPIIARASKMAFSTALNPVDDDDDIRVKGDTPKSTATSRQLQQQQQQLRESIKSPRAGSALLSPGSKPSRIPKLRL